MDKGEKYNIGASLLYEKAGKAGRKEMYSNTQ